MAKSVCLARELFHVVRDEHLEPFLRNWGFKHLRKDEFYRENGDALWRVVTMFVRDVPRDQGRIDTGVGVGYYSLDAFLKTCPVLADSIKLSRGKPTAIGADLALLHPRENRELWIFASSDPAQVANAILDELRTVGLDWFEQFGSLEQTIAAWEAKKCRHIRDTLYLAAAYWLRGDPDRAVALVERERDQYGPFEQKRALFHEVERAAQFRDWLIQQPKSGTVSGEDAKKTKPRRGKQ